MLPEDLNTAGTDIIIQEEGDDYVAYPVSLEAAKYFRLRGLPKDLVSFRILDDPLEFFAALPRGWTIGVILDDGKLGLIVPSRLQ